MLAADWVPLCPVVHSALGVPSDSAPGSVVVTASRLVVADHHIVYVSSQERAALFSSVSWFSWKGCHLLAVDQLVVLLVVFPDVYLSFLASLLAASLVVAAAAAAAAAADSAAVVSAGLVI